MTMPPDNRPRASRAIKLVLMGVAGAALLYSCTPGSAAAWASGRGCGSWAIRSRAAPARHGAQHRPRRRRRRRRPQPSQRGGFGSSAGEHGSTGELTMQREASTPRPGWQGKLEQLGFDYYVMDGKAYWTEQACYAFTSDEVDQLEAATETLHELCLKAVEHVVVEQAVGAHAHPAGLGRLHRPPCGGATTRPWSAASISPMTARVRPSCSNTTPTRRPRSTRPR